MLTINSYHTAVHVENYIIVLHLNMFKLMEVSLLQISGENLHSTLKHLYDKRSVSLNCYSKMGGQAYYKTGFWYILNELRM